MNDDKKIMALIVTIPLLAVLLIFAISKVKFELALSPMEKKIFNFNNENIPRIVERKPETAIAVRNPMTVSHPKQQEEYPKTSLAAMAPLPVITEKSEETKKANEPPAKEVSFILLQRDRGMAIIDGKFVREGDVIAHQKIVKIEKNRVLLKDGTGETWLKLE